MTWSIAIVLPFPRRHLLAALASHWALRSRPEPLTFEGRTEHLALVHLSIINAPVFGGFMGLRVSGSNPDDSLLDVLAVEELPPYRLILAAIHQLLHIGRPVRGVHALHVP